MATSIDFEEDDSSLLCDIMTRISIPNMKRRSLSASAKKRTCRSSENVPMITVEDCSDESSDSNDFFNVPARPRARTCPEDFFRQPKSRPPTPPPKDEIKFKPISKQRSREKLTFAHHKLDKVAEDSLETNSSTKDSKKSSQKLSGKDKLKKQSSNKEISLLSKNKRSLICRPVGFTECG